MVVVSNTSPIVNLATIGQAQLLHELYDRVIIPEAVREELEKGGAQLGLGELLQTEWLECRAPSDRSLVSALEMELDRGEAEAIALSVELKAHWTLIDETKGRQSARRLGVQVIGLLGVLVLAKHRGLIMTVRPQMDALIEKAGFCIGRELYEHVLQTAGE